MESLFASSPFRPFERVFLAAAGIVAVGVFLTAMHFQSIGTCVASGKVRWFDNSTVLWFGWGGIIFGQFGWYANVPFSIAVIHLMIGRSLNSIAVVSAQILFCAWALIPIPLAHNEGYSERVCAYGAGFWLWIIAQGTVIFVSVIARKMAAERTRKEQAQIE